MTAKRVVIVGGGGGGDAAAFALRKRGFDGEITIISADLDRPYDRPYLSKEFLRGEVDLQKVFLHDEAEYSKERIELRLQERVVGGSLQDRRLSLQSGREVGFDTLVVKIGNLAAGFGKPVLLLEGDSHIFRMDNPFSASSPLHGMHPSTPTAENVTRIVVEGSAAGRAEYLRLTFDPQNNGGQLFSYERVPLH